MVTVQATAEPAMTFPRLAMLHLAPGALATLLVLVVHAPIEAGGFPPVLAILVAVAVVIVPFELIVVVRAGTASPDGGWLAAVPYRRPMRPRDWLLLWPALIVAATIGFGVLSLLDAPIRDTLFAWAPAWLRNPVPVDNVDGYSASAWIVTLAGLALVNVIIGPVVEEIYFRGYLLPRMGQFGSWAPLINVTLFSLYHFWSPWQFLARIAGATPWTYAVWWKRNVYVGVAVHVAVNAIGTAFVAAAVLGRLG